MLCLIYHGCCSANTQLTESQTQGERHHCCTWSVCRDPPRGKESAFPLHTITSCGRSTEKSTRIQWGNNQNHLFAFSHIKHQDVSSSSFRFVETLCEKSQITAVRTDGSFPSFLPNYVSSSTFLCIYLNRSCKKHRTSAYLIKFYQSFHINLTGQTWNCTFAVMQICFFCFSSQQQSDLVKKKNQQKKPKDTKEIFSWLKRCERVWLSLVCDAANTKAQPPNTATASQNRKKGAASGPHSRPDPAWLHWKVKTDIYWQQQCAPHSLFDK